MAEGFRRAFVRLLRHQLQAAGGVRRRAMAARTRRSAASDHAAVCRRKVSNARRPREACQHRVGSFPRAAGRRISVHPEYRPNGGTLAHAHENQRGADPGAPLAACVAGNESARRQAFGIAQPRFGGYRFRAAGACVASNCGSPKSPRPARCLCRFISRRRMSTK